MTITEYLAQRGNKLALSQSLNVSHTTVMRWAEGGVPADRVGDVARATGLNPRDVRPDLAALFCDHAGASAPA